MSLLPEIELPQKGRRYERLIEMTQGLEPMRTAVVHPVDTPSLLGAVEAARAGLIVPVLVGPGAQDPRRGGAGRASICRHTRSLSTEHSDAAAARPSQWRAPARSRR